MNRARFAVRATILGAYSALESRTPRFMPLTLLSPRKPMPDAVEQSLVRAGLPRKG